MGKNNPSGLSSLANDVDIGKKERFKMSNNVIHAAVTIAFALGTLQQL